MDEPASLSGGWRWNAAMLERGWLPSRSPAAREAAPSAVPGQEAPIILVANFQAHLPAFEATFNAGACVRCVPGPGDTMQMVAGPNGGTDVYLNLGGHGAGGLGLAPLPGASSASWSRMLREELLGPGG